MKLRFSKVTVAASSAAVLAAGGAAMAATGTIPGVLTSDSAPTQAERPAVAPAQGPADRVAPEVPSAKDVPGAGDVKDAAGKAKVPGLSSLPKGCADIPNVLTVGSGIERKVVSTAGLRLTKVKAGQVSVRGAGRLCEITQTYATKITGQTLRVTTLRLPKATKLVDVAQGMNMVKPESANVGGDAALAGSTSGNSNGYAMLWVQQGTTAVYVSSASAPSAASALPGGASALRSGAEQRVKLVVETLRQVG